MTDENEGGRKKCFSVAHSCGNYPAFFALDPWLYSLVLRQVGQRHVTPHASGCAWSSRRHCSATMVPAFLLSRPACASTVSPSRRWPRCSSTHAGTAGDQTIVDSYLMRTATREANAKILPVMLPWERRQAALSHLTAQQGKANQTVFSKQSLSWAWCWGTCKKRAKGPSFLQQLIYKDGQLFQRLAAVSTVLPLLDCEVAQVGASLRATHG